MELDVNNATAITSILAIVISLIAIYQTYRGTKDSADSAVIDMYFRYSETDFHLQTRAEAWLCLLLARHNDEYRLRLLRAISGPSEETEEYIAKKLRQRSGKDFESDADDRKFHAEYHRLLDIIGFFSALSHLNARPQVLTLCNFFYDSWRGPLYRLLNDHLEYLQEDESISTEVREIGSQRNKKLAESLAMLDRRFGYSKFEVIS